MPTIRKSLLALTLVLASSWAFVPTTPRPLRSQRTALQMGLFDNAFKNDPAFDKKPAVSRGERAGLIHTNYFTFSLHTRAPLSS
jgi:hypothetical protein